MWMLLPLLAIPLVVLVVAKVKWPEAFTVKEFLLLEAIMVALMVGGFFTARWGAVQDTEKWNGRITAKDHGTEPCCHCYEVCQTCTDSDGNSYSCNCVEVCPHVHDYWWSVDVSTGDRITMRSCEPNKHNSPKAWDDAYVGEPASVEHLYTNYLLADPDSVFRQSADLDGAASAPSYPGVHSHYKANQALNLGTKMPKAEWDMALRELNADLGAGKQVNVIVIATDGDDPRYADVVERAWLYGKKNDLVFVLGTEGDRDTISWARVVTISRVESLKIKVRDEMPGKKLSDVEGTVGFIRDLTYNEFERTPMAEFEYLMSAAKPKPWMLWLLYIVAIVGSVGGSAAMVIYDPFGDERRARFRSFGLRIPGLRRRFR